MESEICKSKYKNALKILKLIFLFIYFYFKKDKSVNIFDVEKTANNFFSFPIFHIFYVFITLEQNC